MVNHVGVKMQLTKIRSLPWCGSLSSKVEGNFQVQGTKVKAIQQF